MLRTLTTLCLVAGMMSSGCYLGRSRDAKTIAYVSNGAMVVFGGAMMGAASGAGEESTLIGTLGLVPFLVGATGIAINLVVHSEDGPEVKPMPKAAQLVLRTAE